MHDYIHSSISFSICFPHTRHTRLYMTCLSFHLQIDRTLLSRIRIVFLKSVIWIRSCSVVQWWTSSRRPWCRAAQRRQQPERGDPIFQRRGQEGHWPGFSYPDDGHALVLPGLPCSFYSGQGTVMSKRANGLLFGFEEFDREHTFRQAIFRCV